MTEEAFDFALHQVLSPTLLIVGGYTDMAVCDNKPHRWLESRYKELDMIAHMQSLSSRPDKVPKSTKQDVLDRAWQAWIEFDHSCGAGLHKSLGYTTALDGSEDHCIDTSAAHFWERLCNAGGPIGVGNRGAAVGGPAGPHAVERCQ